MSKSAKLTSVECEQAILGALLLSPRTVIPQVLDVLDKEDFSLERHALVYAAIVALPAETVDLRTVQAELEKAGVFEQVGGLAMLAGLDESLPDLGGVPRYVQIVRERSALRAVVDFCAVTVRDISAGNLSAEEAVQRLTDAGSELGHRVDSRHPRAIGDVAVDAATALHDLDQDGMIGYSWGYRGLDLLTQGLVPGNLVVVAGRTSMGKSAFALNVAADVAIRQRRPVVYFSLEMSETDLAHRLFAAQPGMRLSEVRAGCMAKSRWETLYAWIREARDVPLYIDDSSAIALSQIAARSRHLRAQHDGLGLVVIDYLQLLTSEGKFENRNLQIAGLTKQAKALAKELGVPIMLLSQLSRHLERRSDPRPRLHDLRDSGAIEQDADLVAFIFRPGKNDLNLVDDEAEIIIAKHRNGETGVVALGWDGPTVTFREVA